MNISQFSIFIAASFILGYTVRYILERLFSSKTATHFFSLTPRHPEKEVLIPEESKNYQNKEEQIEILEKKEQDKTTEEHKEDLLQIIEGIGPKTELVLKKEGIYTFDQLADMKDEDLRKLLDKEGDLFTLVNTSSWPTQAAFARDGDISKLKAYQNKIFRDIE
jgi:predicted flap endonuclease-1-like 5' DNA nuclease